MEVTESFDPHSPYKKRFISTARFNHIYPSVTISSLTCSTFSFFDFSDVFQNKVKTIIHFLVLKLPIYNLTKHCHYREGDGDGFFDTAVADIRENSRHEIAEEEPFRGMVSVKQCAC